MLVKLQGFTDALAKVKAFASDTKNVPGVLLDIRDNYVAVCYHDGKKAVIDKVEAFIHEGDPKEPVVIPYDRIVDIIDACQPSGSIQTGDLTFEFSETSLVIKAQKYVAVQADDDNIENRIVSSFEQKLNWTITDEKNMRVKVLTALPYEDIFKGEDEDTWNVDELKEALVRTSIEKGKVMCVDSKNSRAFVVYMSYTTVVPTPEVNNDFAINANVASSLVTILSKLPSSCKTVRLSTIDGRYCNVVSDDDNTGIWFEMTKPNKMDVNTLSSYTGRDYSTYTMNFFRDALLNVIKCAIASDKSEKTEITFKPSAYRHDSIALVINSQNSGASVSNDFAVVCEVLKSKDGVEPITELTLPISLKVLETMVSNCKTTYIGFDVSVGEDKSKFIRVADLNDDIIFSSEPHTRESALLATHFTISARESN